MAWVVTAIAGATGLATSTVAIGGAILGSAAIGASATGRATEAATEGQEKSQAAFDAATAAARLDINRLFGQAKDTRESGFGRTLDLLSGAPTRQIEPFQQGSLAAQETTAAGLPQVRNAILGLPTDFSKIGPRSISAPPNIDISKFRPEPAPLPAALPAPNSQPVISPEILKEFERTLSGRQLF